MDGELEDHLAAEIAEHTGGRIRLLERLGEGGMGSVFRALDDRLMREVAVKAIHLEKVESSTRLRFLREARLLSRLEHPGICRIYEYVEGTASDFLVLELIRGRTLTQAMADGLPEQSRLGVAQNVAEAIAAAHGEGIVHRDVSPGNVMITDEGDVKVLDFGIARALGAETATADGASDDRPAYAAPTAAPDAPGLDDRTPGTWRTDVATEYGSIVGTATSMSPEQARGEPVTAASDAYSLGLLLQFLCTGRAPYPDNLPFHELVALAMEGESLPVEGLNLELTRLIEALKARAPEARPSVAEAAERLQHLRDAPKRRRRWLATAAAVLALLLGALKYTYDLRQERDRAETALAEAEEVTDFLEGLFKVVSPGEAQGSMITAREILDRGAERLDRELGGQPRVKARLQETVGDVYRHLGLHDAARPILEASLAQRRQLFGENHAETARSLRALAHVESDSGFLDHAVPLLEQALATQERALGRKDPEVAETAEVLARALRRRGELERAAALFRRAHEILRTSLPPEHPRYIQALASLGLSYSDLGDRARAKTVFHRVLELGEASLGPDHPHVLNTLNNLVYEHLQEQEYAQAATTAEQVIPRLRRTYGLDHWRTLSARRNLAWALGSRGETGRAFELATECLATAERTLGKTHRVTFAVLGVLAEIETLRGEYDRAEEHHRRILEVTTLADPNGTPASSRLLRLAKIALFENDPVAAESLLGEACEQAPRPPESRPIGAGASHFTIESRHLRAVAAFLLGDLDRAEALCRENLAVTEPEIPREVLPATSPILHHNARTHRLLGRVLAARGDLEGARQCWRLTAERMAFKPDSIYAQAEVAMALLYLDRTAEATPIARKVLRGYRHPELIALCQHHGIEVPELS